MLEVFADRRAHSRLGAWPLHVAMVANKASTEIDARTEWRAIIAMSMSWRLEVLLPLLRDAINELVRELAVC